MKYYTIIVTVIAVGLAFLLLRGCENAKEFKEDAKQVRAQNDSLLQREARFKVDSAKLQAAEDSLKIRLDSSKATGAELRVALNSSRSRVKELLRRLGQPITGIDTIRDDAMVDSLIANSILQDTLIAQYTAFVDNLIIDYDRQLQVKDSLSTRKDTLYAQLRRSFVDVTNKYNQLNVGYGDIRKKYNKERVISRITAAAALILVGLLIAK